jgi:hypothetical protein
MTRYIFNEETMFCDIADGIAIIINSVTGLYYSMNGFGTSVFENLQAGASYEDVVIAIKAMPDAPAGMEERVATFIETLKKFDIMREGAGGGANVNLDAAAAQEDSFEFTVDEYKDAQELLLADPIHEVKNETGWMPDKEALETDEEVVQKKHDKTRK